MNVALIAIVLRRNWILLLRNVLVLGVVTGLIILILRPAILRNLGLLVLLPFFLVSSFTIAVRVRVILFNHTPQGRSNSRFPIALEISEWRSGAIEISLIPRMNALGYI